MPPGVALRMGWRMRMGLAVPALTCPGKGWRRGALLMVLAASGPVACYSMRFELVDEPAAEVVTERKSFYAWGLAPTVEVDVLAKCPHGAAAVSEETTVVDSLLSLPTLGFWAPRTSTYYCRAAFQPPARGTR